MAVISINTVLLFSVCIDRVTSSHCCKLPLTTPGSMYRCDFVPTFVNKSVVQQY